VDVKLTEKIFELWGDWHREYTCKQSEIPIDKVKMAMTGILAK